MVVSDNQHAYESSTAGHGVESVSAIIDGVDWNAETDDLFFYDAMSDLDMKEVANQLEDAVKENARMKRETLLLSDFVGKYLPATEVADVRT